MTRTASIVSSTARIEGYVRGRFDAQADRFKAGVDARDPRLDAVVRHLGPGLSGSIVLDLGCGKGRFAAHLERRGARMVGLDLSMGMLREAGGLQRRVLGSSRRLPFRSGIFDGAVAVEVFEHLSLDSIVASLRELRRVLRPGAPLVVVDKNALSLDTRRPWLPGVVVKWIDQKRGFWMYPPDSEFQERWFQPGRFSRWLENAGFRDVRCEPIPLDEERSSRVFRVFPALGRFRVWAGYATEQGGA